jgi:hypothetical protein
MGKTHPDSSDDSPQCRICGYDEDPDALKDGLCYVCRQYPEGSFQWHLGIAQKGGEFGSDELDAFTWGWNRAMSEIVRPLEEILEDAESAQGAWVSVQAAFAPSSVQPFKVICEKCVAAISKAKGE